MSRCKFRLGAQRCADTTGLPHGHWLRPDDRDPDLRVTRAEVEELLAYMERQFLDPNAYPMLKQLLDRLEEL